MTYEDTSKVPITTKMRKHRRIKNTFFLYNITRVSLKYSNDLKDIKKTSMYLYTAKKKLTNFPIGKTRVTTG